MPSYVDYQLSHHSLSALDHVSMFIRFPLDIFHLHSFDAQQFAALHWSTTITTSFSRANQLSGGRVLIHKIKNHFPKLS